MADANPLADDRTGLLVMTAEECEELLASTPIGRVVFVDDGQPIALPVNYRWFEDCVVFRTLEGQKLRAAVLEAPVSFEVDRWDPVTQSGASVLVKGQASDVTDWAEKERLEELGVVPWAKQPWKQSWVRIVPDEVTGRRLR